MEVVCIEEVAFFKLFDKVIDYVNQKYAREDWKWIDGEEAMKRLNISSKTTLQKLRDQGKIAFSQPQPRTIVYDKTSIDTYLEHHKRQTF